MKHGNHNTSIQMLRNFSEMKFDNRIRNSFGDFPGGSLDHRKANIYCILGIGAPCQVVEPITCAEAALLGHATKTLDGARDFKANML